MIGQAIPQRMAFKLAVTDSVENRTINKGAGHSTNGDDSATNFFQFRIFTCVLKLQKSQWGVYDVIQSKHCYLSTFSNWILGSINLYLVSCD